MSRSCFFALAALGCIAAARADTLFNVGDFNCDERTLVCSSTDAYTFFATVGIDTVYASDGVTVLETLEDFVIGSPLGPTIANDIATDVGIQPPLLQANLGPFTTLTDVQFIEDNQYYGQNLPGCPTPPNELLTQGGSLIPGVEIENVGPGLYTSPSIYTDLTGAVSGATVTSDVVSSYGSDVYNLDTPVSSPVCGTTLPTGYSALIVQSVVVGSFIENITEVENSSVPEPAAWVMMLGGIGILIVRRRIQ